MTDSLKVIFILFYLVLPGFDAYGVTIPCQKGKPSYKACMAAQAYKHVDTVRGALKYLVVDCRNKRYPSSCFYLGNYFYKKERYKAAAAAYESICLSDHSSQCFNLGITLFHLGKKARSESILSGVCQKSGYARACALSAKYMEDISQNQALVAHLNQACAQGDGDSCLRMANFHEERKNTQAARRFYSTGCDSGSVYACMNLAGYYESVGNVVASRKVLKRACQAGHVPSCTRVKPKSLDDRIRKVEGTGVFFRDAAVKPSTYKGADGVGFSELED